MISTVQAQWNSGTMRVQIEKACAAEAIWRLELGKVRRTAEPLPAKVRRGEIDFRLRAGGTIPSLKSRLSNKPITHTPPPHQSNQVRPAHYDRGIKMISAKIMLR